MTARYPLVLNGTTIEEVQSADTLTGLTSGNSILAGDNSGGIKNVSLSGNISFDGNTLTVSAVTFPAGTVMLFIQAAAPTGWTKSTTHDNKALRIVSGSGGGSGGSLGFTTAFGSSSTDATTLSTSQIPSHNHGFYFGNNYASSANVHNNANLPNGNNSAYFSGITNTGGGGSHTHTLSLAVQYVDAIICVKNQA